MEDLLVNRRRKMVKTAFKKSKFKTFEYKIFTGKEESENIKFYKDEEFIILENSKLNFFGLRSSYSTKKSNWSYGSLTFANMKLKDLNRIIEGQGEKLYRLKCHYSMKNKSDIFYSEIDFIDVWMDFEKTLSERILPFISILKTPRDFYEFRKYHWINGGSYAAMTFMILTKIFEPEKLELVEQIWQPLLDKGLQDPEAKPLIERKIAKYQPYLDKMDRSYVLENNIFTEADFVQTGTSEAMRAHVFFINKGVDYQGGNTDVYYNRICKEYPAYFSE